MATFNRLGQNIVILAPEYAKEHPDEEKALKIDTKIKKQELFGTADLVQAVQAVKDAEDEEDTL